MTDPTQPHKEQIQSIVDHIDHVTLDPYMLPGNRMVREGYMSLEQPSALPQDNPGYSAFPQDRYHRKDWNWGGVGGNEEEFFNCDKTILPVHLGMAIATGSPLERWRSDEKNKTAIEKGEMRDCIEQLVDDLEAIVGKKGNLRFGLQTSLLMWKRT